LTEAVAAALIAIGAFFLAAGSIGLIRFPDVLCRMHATTKTTTLGACTILLAAVVQYGHSPIGLKAVLAVVFFLLTAPVGAHMIARAAYRGRVPLAAHRMVADDLKAVVEQSAYLPEPGPDTPESP
jgi:multicomponent Na+:H+ antiporter subunit G